MKNSVFEVIFSKEFDRKLANLIFYINYKFCNPSAGKRLMEKLISSGESLASFPERHPVMFKEKSSGYKVRKFVVDKYIISYYFDNEKKIVYINDLISSK